MYLLYCSCCIIVVFWDHALLMICRSSTRKTNLLSIDHFNSGCHFKTKLQIGGWQSKGKPLVKGLKMICVYATDAASLFSYCLLPMSL